MRDGFGSGCIHVNVSGGAGFQQDSVEMEVAGQFQCSILL